MRKIITNTKEEEIIKLKNINPHAPIFAKYKGKLVGMLVIEKGRWALATDAAGRSTKPYETLNGCIESCIEQGYTFYVDY